MNSLPTAERMRLSWRYGYARRLHIAFTAGMHDGGTCVRYEDSPSDDQRVAGCARGVIGVRLTESLDQVSLMRAWPIFHPELTRSSQFLRRNAASGPTAQIGHLAASPGLRWFLLGDWGRIVRDPIDVLRLAFIAGAIAFIFMGKPGSIGLGVSCVVLIVARRVNLPRPYDFGVVITLSLLAWGTSLGLYGRIEYYDKFVHFLAPLLYAPIVYIVLVRLDVLCDLGDMPCGLTRHSFGIFLVTLAIGLAISAGYEIVEWTSDYLVGSSLVKNETDTATDLMAGMVGAAIGGLGLVLWGSLGWTTVRRAPPEQVRSSARAS